MSPLPVVHCAGAPRDMGRDQGEALARRIGNEALRIVPSGWPARWLIEGLPTGRPPRVRRDTLRFFPHMGERAMGLAGGARVGTLAIAGLLGEALDGERGPALVAGTDDEARLARAVHGPVDALAVRHSAPDTDHRSLELVLAWRVPALVGVNEHGLAVSASAHRDRAAERDCRAPAVLLAQDCLQRFDVVEKAVEWLERRPAGGAASFLLLDATGARARVDVAGSARGVSRERTLALGVDAPPGAEASPSGLCGALGPADAHVVVEPAARRLGVLRAGADPEWHEVASA